VPQRRFPLKCELPAAFYDFTFPVNLHSNIVFGSVELSGDDFFHFSDSQTCGHVYKQYRNFNRTNTRMSFFSQRVIGI